MMPVRWTSDGWPYITRGNEEVPMIVSRSGVTRNDNVTFGNFEKNYDFSAEKLDYDWHTLRGTAQDYYSLTENPGYLTMKCTSVSSVEKKELPFVCRRVQHHKYECATRMIFRPEDESQCAGLLVMKDETHQYLLNRCLDGDTHCVAVHKIGKGGKELLAKTPVDGDVLNLKVVSDGNNYGFHFSTDDGKTWQELLSGADANYTSTATAGGFTGTTVGLYASSVR